MHYTTSDSLLRQCVIGPLSWLWVRKITKHCMCVCVCLDLQAHLHVVQRATRGFVCRVWKEHEGFDQKPQVTCFYREHSCVCVLTGDNELHVLYHITYVNPLSKHAQVDRDTLWAPCPLLFGHRSQCLCSHSTIVAPNNTLLMWNFPRVLHHRKHAFWFWLKYVTCNVLLSVMTAIWSY